VELRRGERPSRHAFAFGAVLVLRETARRNVSRKALGPATCVEHIAPLLVSHDLETHNGAMFDQKGNRFFRHPSWRTRPVSALIANSEALVARANVRPS
jgi:hypothetical protein